MCTSLTLNSGAFYFGRNLDLEYSFGEQVVITPRHYPFSFQFTAPVTEHYAMIGMAQVSGNVPLYAEAANEKGLCLAALNFPGNAYYQPEPPAQGVGLAPYELFAWLLGSCATVDEACRRLASVQLVHASFQQLPVAPLHWHLADRERSVVLESTKDGVHLYENPVGVLTNNPPFPWQLTHLRSYLNLTAGTPENRFAAGLDLQPFGQGMGALGLPGDASPASRFVRAAFCRWNSVCPPEEEASVAQVFHILENVAMVSGTVLTPEGRCDKTTYACCINADQGIYYYRTWENSQITAVRLRGADLDGMELTAYPQRSRQQILYEN